MVRADEEKKEKTDILKQECEKKKDEKEVVRRERKGRERITEERG